MKIVVLFVLLLPVAVMAKSSSEQSSFSVILDKVMEEFDEEQEKDIDLDVDFSDQKRDMRECSNFFGKTVCYNCKPICRKRNMQCGRLQNKMGKAICHSCRARCSLFNRHRLTGDVEDFDDHY